MSETEQLIAEANALIERQADAAPLSARDRILVGDVADDRTRILVRVTRALEDERRMRRLDTDHVRYLEEKIAAVDAGGDAPHADPLSEEELRRLIKGAIGYDPVRLSIRDHPEITWEYRTAHDRDSLVDRISAALLGRV